MPLPLKIPHRLYKLTAMGYVFTFNDAKAYENWCGSPANQIAFQREARLMMELLTPQPGRSVLDVGCGIGGSLVVLKKLGLTVTGIDPSPYMLDSAKAALGAQADLHRCKLSGVLYFLGGAFLGKKSGLQCLHGYAAGHQPGNKRRPAATCARNRPTNGA